MPFSPTREIKVGDHVAVKVGLDRVYGEVVEVLEDGYVVVEVAGERLRRQSHHLTLI